MIRHLLLTDLRRFRLVLAAWLALIAAHTWVLLLQAPSAGDAVRYRRLEESAFLIEVTVFLATMLLATLVFQADTSIGTDAFWLTRPVHPWKLLAAKAALLTGAVIVVPGLIEIVVMKADGMPAAAIARVAAESTVSGLYWLALFSAAAAITRNLGMLALTWLGLILAAALVDVLTNIVLGGDQSWSIGVSTVSAQAVWTVGQLVSFVAIVLVQYRHRRLVWSIAVGIACAATAFVIASRSSLEPKETAPAWVRDPNALQLTATPVATLDAEADWVWARMPVQIAGVRPGWKTSAMLLGGTLAIDGRVTDVSARHGEWPLPFAPSHDSPDTAVIRALLQVAIVQSSSPDPPDGVAPFAKDELQTPPQAAHVTYTGRFRVALSQAELVTTAPLGVGAILQDGPFRQRVEAIAVRDGLLQVRTVRSWASSALDRRPLIVYEMYAVNDARSDARYISQIAPSGDGDVPTLFSAHFPMFDGGFVRTGLVSLESMESQRSEKPTAGAPPIDDSWMASAHLALVRWTRTGSVERTLSVSDLKICQSRPGC